METATQGNRQQETASRPSGGSSGSIRAKTRRASTSELEGFRNPGSYKSLSGTSKASEQETGVGGVRRKRSGFVAFSSHRYQLSCKSPSTDSTTSLAQLRDKLTILSPLIFNKVPGKIVSSPGLSSIKEIVEHENFKSLPKGIRSGHATKYHSDTEAQRTTKKYRSLSPVIEKQSASLLLVAALDKTNESIKDDIFDKLYKDKLNFDLADLLVAEALQHGQEKDSGIISGKLTQDCDIVENTPVEKNVRHNKLSIKCYAKSIVEKKPTSDESDTEVIDDTPCYVYDRKAKVRDNSKKTVSKTPVDIHILDDKVDDFFSQRVNQNTENIVISPTLAKKINETSSEASDDDCEFIEYFVDNEDIVDCVNSVINKVCDDLDNAKQLKKQEYQLDMWTSAQKVGESSNSAPDVPKTSTNKLKTDKNMSEESKKVTLKFKASKKTAPKVNTRKKTKKSATDLSKIEKSNVLRERTNTFSPINTTKVSSTRKKRKLYSPKDDEKANNETPIPRNKAERKQTNVNQTPIATCYRELENVRKSRRISSNSRASTRSKNNSKKPRYNMSSESGDEDPSFHIKKHSSSISLSKPERSIKPVNYREFQYSPFPSSSSAYDSDDHNRTKKTKTARKTKPRSCKTEKKTKVQSVLSPKTKNLNEMFDAIKENVVNDEKITLVEKKGDRDFSVYNLSSESEDGDFKKKKIQVQKRVSSSSLESSATKRQRLMNRVNYTKYYSSEDEDKRTRKLKTVKQAKPRTRKMKKIPKDNLIDERMRTAPDATLETSFVKETVGANNQTDSEPQLEQAPVLEVIAPEILPDDETEVIVLENKTTPHKLGVIKIKQENNSNKKITKSTLTKKDKDKSKAEFKEKDSAPVSPLPGLVVETERTRKDDLTASIEADLFQKCKRIYTDVQNLSETDGTQQLLNVSDNANEVLDPTEILETVLVPDALSEKTITTGGSSPITGHNDLNESPPNLELLDENFEHRDVHNERMNISLAEFLDNMRNQLQCIPATTAKTSPVIPMTRAKSTRSTRSNLLTQRVSSESINTAESIKSNPTVKLRRMSQKEIESNLNPAGTPSSRVSRVPSVVLTRISSEEVKKYLPPNLTITSSSTGTPKIVLERIPSEEMNKLLPKFKVEERRDDERPKQYNTRRNSLKSTKSSLSNVFGKTKTKISPVKLNFDSLDLTMASDRVKRAVRTRSSTRSVDTNAANSNKEPVKMKSLKSVALVASVANVAPNKSEEYIKNSQETIKSSAATKEKSKEKTPMPAMDRSDMASVQDWLKRNATLNSPSANNQAVKEMLNQMMETIQTTLADIHQATGEMWTAAFMKQQDDMKSIEQDLKRAQEKFKALKKNQRDRACEVIRAEVEKKTLMVKLLQEDIERGLKLI